MPDDRISCTERSNTSSGAVVGDQRDPEPNQRRAEIQSKGAEEDKGTQAAPQK